MFRSAFLNWRVATRKRVVEDFQQVEEILSQNMQKSNHFQNKIFLTQKNKILKKCMYLERLKN